MCICNKVSLFKMDYKVPDEETSQMTVSHFWQAIRNEHYHKFRQLIKYHKRRNTLSKLFTLNEKSSLQLIFQFFEQVDQSNFSYYITIANELIETGADVNQFFNSDDEDNVTLLHYNCNYHKLEASKTLKSLLRNGANVNSQTLLDNKPHYTPLHYAVHSEYTLAVRLLLIYGADPNIPDVFGQTALMHAALTKNNEIFSYFLDHYETDVNFHIENGPIALEHALCSENLDKFNTLWNLTDIKLINERLEDILDTMITCMWYKPDKIKYFYKVLNTPGIILPQNFRFLHRLAIELLRMGGDYDDEIVEEELSEEEFLEIDVYGFVKILLEKGVQILDEDFEGIVYLCHEYHVLNLPERELELLNLLVDNNIKISPHVIYFSVINHPKFCITLLQFCPQCDPTDVFKHIILSNRVTDVEILELIKLLLNICDPLRNIKLQCAGRIKMLFESKMNYVRTNQNSPGKLTTPAPRMVDYYETDSLLYNEVYNTLVIQYGRDSFGQLFRDICDGILYVVTTNNIVYNLIWVPVFKLYEYCKIN